jgi:hypothetical protein
MVMYVSDVLTVRVPADIRNAMEGFEINWSEYLRDSIRRKIVELRREKAFKKMDEVRAKNRGKAFNMSEEVIKWRKRH